MNKEKSRVLYEQRFFNTINSGYCGKLLLAYLSPVNHDISGDVVFKTTEAASRLKSEERRITMA
jgi:hypothetical protein